MLETFGSRLIRLSDASRAEADAEVTAAFGLARGEVAMGGVPALARDVQSADSRHEADTRIAPDPFAAVLPALAALGAIASIAAVNWVAQETTPERARVKRKAGIALKGLESCCLGLQEIFRQFQRHPNLFAGEGPPASSPLKFGVHGPRVAPDAARLYQQLINDVASMLVLAAQNSFDVMSAVEDGEINAPEELFFGFGEQQERLNKLIAQRASLKGIVEGGLEIADRLAALVGSLRKYKLE